MHPRYGTSDFKLKYDGKSKLYATATTMPNIKLKIICQQMFP